MNAWHPNIMRITVYKSSLFYSQQECQGYLLLPFFTSLDRDEVNTFRGQVGRLACVHFLATISVTEYKRTEQV